MFYRAATDHASIESRMIAEPVQVVVVDDRADAAETMAVMLRLIGYEVRIACNADDALALIRQRQPHCVLFDVVMPGMGGDELCRRLRESHGDDIVLIAVTGWDEGDERVGKSFSLADHFFTKPVDHALLVKVLGHLR